MTPKEKAKELVDKMVLDWGCNECHNHWAEECALIAVDELIKEQTMWQNRQTNPVLYWQEVKKEIQLL